VIELEQTVNVARPRDEVFAHLERPSDYGSWLPGIRSVAVEGDGPLVADAALRVQFDGPTGPLTALGSVTELTPPDCLAIHAESRELRFDARFSLTPTETGTSIVLALRLELRGMFRFAERMVAARAPAELTEALERLRAGIEAAPD
jgi:carbon monoxide dehydrogenase subunit G